MATVSPPSSPGPPAQPPSGPPPGPARPRASRAGVARWLAGGALIAVVIVLLVLLLGGGGGSDYKLEFAEAGQLVRGDQVQVGGVPVGSVKDLELTKNYTAIVTIHVSDSLAPLHQGTKAQVRVPSLSSVANRYIALEPGPNNAPSLPAGSRLPASATQPVVDLDQLFNIFNPKTRKGLQGFIRGSAEQYAGSGKALGQVTEYFPPFLSASDHIFRELVSDEKVFTNFLVETAKAVTTIAGRGEQLSGFIEHANQTFEALGSQQSSLARGLRQLPGTIEQGNQTFKGVPATFAALKQLVDASKPTSKPLTTFFTKLRPVVVTATPVVSNFSLSFNRPGPNNDLTDYVRALPELARALTTASPSGVQALKESVPITAFWGPYSPDLEGTLRQFGQTSSYYDANGHYARVSPVFPDFKLGANNNLTPSTAGQALETLKTGQLRRCAGAATQPPADGSAPFADNGLLTCDPTERP